MYRLFWQMPDGKGVQMSVHKTLKGAESAWYRRVTLQGAVSASLWGPAKSGVQSPIKEKLTLRQKSAKVFHSQTMAA